MSFTTSATNSDGIGSVGSSQPARRRQKMSPRRIMVLSNRLRGLRGLGITDAEAQAYAQRCTQSTTGTIPWDCYTGPGIALTNAVAYQGHNTSYNAGSDAMYQQYVENSRLNNKTPDSFDKYLADHNRSPQQTDINALYQSFTGGYSAPPTPNVPPPPPVDKYNPVPATTYTNWQPDPYQWSVQTDAAGNPTSVSYVATPPPPMPAAQMVEYLNKQVAANPVTTAAPEPQSTIPAYQYKAREKDPFAYFNPILERQYSDPYLSESQQTGYTYTPAWGSGQSTTPPAGSTPPPAQQPNLPPATPPPAGGAPPVIISGPLTNPTGSVLPPAVANAAPQWFKDLPIWQTGLLAAGVGYAIYASKQTGRRR